MSARPVIRQLAQLDDYAALSDAAAGTPSLRTLGAGATQAAAGNHGHAASAITSGVLAMARLATGTPTGTKFIRDDGTLAVPAAGDPTMGGDLSGPASAAVVADDSHAHTTTTISGLDAADVSTGTFATARIPSVTAAMVAADVATQAELDASALLAPILANATAARNTITPTANVSPLTVHGFNSATAAPGPDFISHANPDSSGEGKFIRFFNEEYHFWTPGDPHSYFNTVGAYRTMRDVIISGYRQGAGTSSFYIEKPTTDTAMLWLWSDVIHATVQMRVNASQASSYHISALDGSTPPKYVWTLERNGDIRWGNGTTYASLDTTLGRSAANTLSTPGNLTVVGLADLATVDVQPATDVVPLIVRNKSGGGSTAKVIQAFDGNATEMFYLKPPNEFWMVGTATFKTSVGMSFEPAAGPVQFKQPFGVWMEFTAAGSLKFTNGTKIEMSEAQNLQLGTTTGTKIGTATTQKIGFWNATPIVQPTAVADPTGGAIIDIECRAQLAALLSRLRTTGGMGLIAG